MAERSDGSVNIVVNMDVDDAEKELARLKQKVFKLEESLTVGKTKKNVLLDKLKQAEAELEEFYSRAGTAQDIKNSPGLTGERDKLLETIESLQKAIDKQNASLENTQMELDGVKTRYSEVTQKAQELADAQAAAEAQQARVDRVTLALQRLAIGFKGIASYALQAGTAVVKGLGKGATTVLKKVGSLAAKAGNGFLGLFKSTKKANGAFGGGLKSLLKYGLGIRSLHALFSKLRSAITEGFKNLAQFSSETNASLSSVKSALTQLKNALATAFAPILTTVAPILTKFINLLAKAADYIARLTAALTGKSTYTRAAKVQEDYATSLSGTGEAAEEATKSLAGFDEINQLTAKDTKDASGGGGADIGGMFEEVAIEPLSFDSWGEAFSAFLDTILNDGIPKLKSALASAAGVINDFAANLAEMFTFPGVYDKVVLIGTEIANAFNDFVNLIDWGTIGTALGAGLNLALGLAVSFVYTFDWANLGASIAELFNRAVEQIDWYNVGMLLWAKFKIAIEALAGFLLNVDMTQLAQAASQLIIGLFNSMSETIYSIDWQALGNQVAALLAGVDWNSVSDSMFEAIGAALGGLAVFLWGIIEDAWDEVVEWWHDVAYEDGQFTIEGLLDGILEACKNIGQWIKEHVVDPIVNGFKKAFGIASPSKVMKELGGFVISGLLEGLKTGMQPIINFFNTVKTNILNVLNQVTKFISGTFANGWKTSWEGIKNTFKGVWNGIISLLESAINAMISGINWLISKLNTISFNIPDWVPGIGGKSFGISIPAVSTVTLPRLATGAVIPPNREFMAVLGDQTSGNNIEAPEALIRKIVREEAGNSSRVEALLQTLIELTREGKTLECDGVAFAKVAKRALNNNSRAYGVPVRG